MAEVQTDPRVPSDAELITSSRAGDEIAYAALYERHAGAARAAARSLTRSHTDADDLVAEAFTRVLQTLRRGGGPEVAFRPYLLTSVRNAFYDRAKRAKREELTDDQADVPSPTGIDDLAGEDNKLIAGAFAQLPERWQLVLWHTEVEGKSPAEVAPLLGLAPNAVAALAYRAREGLRQAYLQAHLQRDVPERCRPFADKLGAYARDGLATRDRRKVDEHLAGCERCRTLLAELGEVNHSLKGVLIPLLLGVPAAAYLSHLGGGIALILARLRSRLPKNPVLAGAVVVVAPLVVAMAGFALLRSDDTKDSTAPATSAIAGAASPVSDAATTPAPTATIAAPDAPSTVVAPPTGSEPAVSPPPAATTVAPPTGTTAEPASDEPGSEEPATEAPTTEAPTPTTPAGTVPPVATTVAPPPPAFVYTITGGFVGPAVAGASAGLQLNLSVAAPPGGPGSFHVQALPRATAPGAEVHVTLPALVTFAGIDDGWSCTQTAAGADTEVVCTSPSLAEAGNPTVLVRLDVDSGLTGTVTIAYEVITSDGGHVVGVPATVAVTSAADLGNPVFVGVEHGDLALAGNTLMSCDAAATGCLDARAGLGNNVDNNDWDMKYVDVDNDPTTFNSSQASLDLPAGSQVLYAGLRWSGDAAAGASGKPGEVVFTDPTGTVNVVVADTVVALASSRFISMADVTARVNVGGNYTVANVAASTGANKYAGWALVVAYRSAQSPARMLLVRDTSESDEWTIPRPQPLNVTVAGLPVAADGRRASVGVVAFEGDRGIAGDSLTANGLALKNDANPDPANVFNSSIVVGAGRQPSDADGFGVDVDRFDTTVPTRADHPEDRTSVTFSFNSTGDQVSLATIALAIDLTG